jgi:hypothetical protein
MAEYGMGTSITAQQDKYKKPTIHMKTDAYSSLRLTRPKLEHFHESGTTINRAH